ncbi:MAG: ATP-binding protein [Brevinematia bacterium]
MNQEGNREVGIVIGTRDSTPFEFWFHVHDDNPAFVDDIVMVVNNIKNVGNIVFYGVVTNIIKGFEGVEFHSFNEEIMKGTIPFQKYHIAYVRTTSIVGTGITSPEPGSRVYKVLGSSETKKAINMENKENLIPAGILKNGEAAYINWEFINGQKGAHVSISGVSGIATKTSYALFLIHSMIYSKTIDDKEKRRTRAIIFSVKGEDLLHIDKENTYFKTDEESKKQFEKLGIDPKPFQEKDINFYTPPDPDDPDRPLTKEVTKKKNLAIYSWSIKDFFIKKLSEYMFDQEEREDDNFTYVLNHFSNVMKNTAETSPENRLEITLNIDKRQITFNITSLYPKNKSNIKEKILKENIVNTSLSELLELSLYESEELSNISEQLKKFFFPSRAPVQTISKFIRRFSVSAKDINFMVLNRDSREVKWNEKRVSVVSISDKFLSFRAQRFVVGSILSELYLGKRNPEEIIFVMIDELNKYAPSTGVSPIKNLLVDIAERGRSLGIILIGAQQMASEVEPRIISNSSIKVIGRIDSGEIENKAYKYLPIEFKEKAKRIKSGTMILFQPDIEIPLVIDFPKPPYATRKEEVSYSLDFEDKYTT